MNNLRFALRMLLKNPGFTVVALSSLALGIGVNTTIFSIVNTFLFPRLPFQEPDRLVALWEVIAKTDGRRRPSTFGTFEAWRTESRCFGRQGPFDGSTAVVTLPIRDTVRVIREIAPLLTPSQVLCDLTSLIVAPVDTMMESSASVIGLHPMFGPGVPSLRGQTIVVTPARCSDGTLGSLISIFEREGAAITLSTPEEHDRVMALVQGLPHFVTLMVADTMRRLSVSPRETSPNMSPVYQIEMGLVGRLLSQERDLYGDMLRLNPFVKPVLGACGESLDEIREIILSDDAGAFREILALTW